MLFPCVGEAHHVGPVCLSSVIQTAKEDSLFESFKACSDMLQEKIGCLITAQSVKQP